MSPVSSKQSPAPTILFPHWLHVDGVYMCRAHHDEWHRVMREHGLRWPHELASAV